MNYRNGTVEDAPAIARVNIETWQISFRGIVPQAFLDAMNLSQRVSGLARRFSKAGYDLIVAEDDKGRIVGFCDFGPPRESRWSYDTELYSIYVEADWQKKGVGTELFERTVARIVDKGGRSMFVRVLEASPFQSFYAQRGGRMVDREDNQIEGQAFDYIIYGWGDLACVGS
jgi:GNAT superfamily N-acetyltransferase